MKRPFLCLARFGPAVKMFAAHDPEAETRGLLGDVAGDRDKQLRIFQPRAPVRTAKEFMDAARAEGLTVSRDGWVLVAPGTFQVLEQLLWNRSREERATKVRRQPPRRTARIYQFPEVH